MHRRHAHRSTPARLIGGEIAEQIQCQARRGVPIGCQRTYIDINPDRLAALSLYRAAKAVELKPPNHKRVYRVMKVHGLLLDRHVGGDERR
jgi:hypothetical protein